MPSRSDIAPGGIPRLLPHVSLIDVEDDPRRFRVRLAGTRLYDIYERELTGAYVDELGWGEKTGYWTAAYRRVADSRRPAQGVVRAPTDSKDCLVQFWLRLPMSDNDDDVTMILCYDAFVPVSKAMGLASISAPERALQPVAACA